MFVPRFADLERQAIEGYPGLSVLKTGAIFYADQSIRDGQQEATFIGALSLVGIMLSLALVFKSVQPIFLSLLAIGAGLAGGMAATLLIFDRVHLMALVFGAGLIGISVDYAIHYCCERFAIRELDSLGRLKNVLPGLTLGMISSVIGFLTLAWAPFPGLQQIAIFSAFGLFASYVTVVLVFPPLDKAPKLETETRLLRLAASGRRVWLGFSAKAINSALFLAIFVGAGAGLYLIEPDDDVRKLQSLPVSLKEQEAIVRNLSGLDHAAQFFLVSGKTTEDVLRAEEKLAADLEKLVARKSLGGYTAIAKMIPSQKRQAEDRALLKERLIDPYLSGFLRTIGVNVGFGYDEAETGFLTPSLITKSAGLPFLDLLTLEDNAEAVVHMVTLSGVKELKALEALSAKQKGVHLIDQGREWSKVLATYRVRALTLLAFAVALIWGFLSFRYRPSTAAKIVAPPLAAIVLTPLVVAGFGGSFTFFNAMALILVFVIGLDYALFCVEAPDEHQDISFFANGLSALSTILAFGLMSFSQLYAVHAFGVTILIGIALTFILSPLARRQT